MVKAWVDPIPLGATGMTTLKSSEWNDIVGYVRVHFPDLVRGWFTNLEPLELRSGMLTIRANNNSQVSYLAEHCRRPFIEAAQAATGMLVSVSFESENTISAKFFAPP